MSPDTTRFLPCHVAGLRLAFDVAGLLGIRRADGIQRSPSSEGPIGWLLEYQDAPVFDAARHLGLQVSHEQDGEDAGRVLLFQGEDGPFGVWVERSGRAQDVGGGTVHALPPLLAHLGSLGCTGLLTADGHAWFVIDAGALPTPDGAPNAALDHHALSALSSPEISSAVATDDSQPPLTQGSPSNSATALGDPAALSKEDDAAGGRLVLFSTPQGDAFSPPVRFGLSLSQVLEVERLPALDPVPQAPPFISGLTLWRQRPLLVLDVDRRMGWSHATTGDRLLVVQLPDGRHLGLVAHGQTRLLRLPIPHRLSELSLGHSLSLGIFDLDDATLIVPDLVAFGVARSVPPNGMEAP